MRIIRRAVVAVLCLGAASAAAVSGEAPPTRKQEAAAAARYAQQAAAAVGRMRDRLKDGQRDYNLAQKEGDGDKVTCISEPLKMLGAVTRLAVGAEVDLKRDVVYRELAGVKSSYVKIATFLGKSEEYYGQLKLCSNAFGQQLAGSGVSVQKIPPADLPRVNATEGLGTLPDNAGYVSSASPFFK